MRVIIPYIPRRTYSPTRTGDYRASKYVHIPSPSTTFQDRLVEEWPSLPVRPSNMSIYLLEPVLKGGYSKQLAILSQPDQTNVNDIY